MQHAAGIACKLSVRIAWSRELLIMVWMPLVNNYARLKLMHFHEVFGEGLRFYQRVSLLFESRQVSWTHLCYHLHT